ncbi:hypothetical protein ABZ249_29885 [Nocardiopsis sp. NPDC006139]|uniref:hypothetical protein n=1 Tax=Nocardiopsis sp. NPDC006139 TaxID=3154578 RepID=UPI0033A490BC
MDIISRIDDTLEAWERGPDAARWTPDGGKPRSKGISVGVPADAGQVFFAPLGTPTEDFSAWTPLGAVDLGPTVSTELSVPQLEPITLDNAAPITLSEEPPPAPEWMHLASCAYCNRTSDEDTTALVFPDQVARREWVDAHQEATGHTLWSLTSVRRDAIAFEY